MKPWQAIVLLMAGCLDCSVLAGGGAFALGLGFPPAAPAAPTATATRAAIPAAPTETIISPTATDTLIALYPTYTSSPVGPVDTPTITPTLDPFADWTSYKGEVFSLMLPSSFAGGNPHTDSARIINELKAKGADFDFKDLSGDMTSSPAATVFYSFDSIRVDPKVVTRVAIIARQADPLKTLNNYMNEAVAELGGMFTMVSERTFVDLTYEGQEATYMSNASFDPPTQLALYSLRKDTIILEILCFTGPDEFESREPVFDQIISSIRITPPS